MELRRSKECELDRHKQRLRFIPKSRCHNEVPFYNMVNDISKQVSMHRDSAIKGRRCRCSVVEELLTLSRLQVNRVQTQSNSTAK